MPDVVLGAELVVKGLGTFKKDMGAAGKATKETRKELKGVGKEGERGFTRLTKATRGFRKGLGSLLSGITKVTAGLLGIGAVGVKSFGDFDLQMGRIQTMLPRGASAMDQFGDAVLNNAVTYGQSIGETANAVFQSLSAGISGSERQMADYNKVVGQAAAGGFTSMATAVDGITNVINAYGLSIDDAREVSDSFFVANRLGKTTFEEIANTVGRVAPTMKTLGGSYKELLAVVIAMTKAGVKTSETMSSLKQVLANIVSPTADAEGAAEGLSFQFNAAGLKSLGMAGFLRQLAEETRGNTQAQVDLFGSVEAFNAIALLTSKTGIRDFNTGLREMKQGAGATEKAFSDVSDTVGFKLKQLKTGVSRAAIEIGFGLTEGLGFDNLNDIPQKVAAAAGTIRGAARSFADAFTEAFAPMWEATGADWEGLAASIGGAAGNIVTAFIEVANIITNLVNSEAFKLLVSTLSAAGSALGFVVSGGATTKEQIKEATVGAGTGPIGIRKGPGGERTFDPILAEMQIRQRTKKRLMTRIAKEQADLGISGHFAQAVDPFSYATAGRSKAQLQEEANAERIKLRREAAHSRRLVKGDQLKEIDRRNATLDAGLASARRINMRSLDEFNKAQDKSKAGLADIAPRDFASWTVNIKQENTTNLKDKKAKARGSFSGRGRGNATINSSSEQNYLLMEGRMVPMSDEFHFGHQISEEPTATLPSAG